MTPAERTNDGGPAFPTTRANADDGADECRRASRRRGIYLAAIIVAVAAAVVWVVAGFVACAVTSVCLSATLPWGAR